LKSKDVALITLLVIGSGMVASGYLLMDVTEPVGMDGQLWLEEDSIMDPNSVRLAWGVRAPSKERFDGWAFQVRLRANGTVWIRSMWHETNQVFYERFDSNFEDALTVNVDGKTSAMEWVWYLQNPSSTAVRLYVVHVSYSAIRKPLRLVGVLDASVGIVAIVLSFSKLVQYRLRN